MASLKKAKFQQSGRHFESYLSVWPLVRDVIPSNAGVFSAFAPFMFTSEEMAWLEPYGFEPKRVSDVTDDDNSENNEMNERLNSTSVWSFWCSSQRCEVMLTPKECILRVDIRNRKTRWKVPILFLALRNHNRI